MSLFPAAQWSHRAGKGTGEQAGEAERGSAVSIPNDSGRTGSILLSTDNNLLSFFFIAVPGFWCCVDYTFYFSSVPYRMAELLRRFLAPPSPACDRIYTYFQHYFVVLLRRSSSFFLSHVDTFFERIFIFLRTISPTSSVWCVYHH